MNEPHITDEQLAALVDGRLPADEDRRATGHLARCRSCMAAYGDIAREVHAWSREAPDSSEAGSSVRSPRWPRMLLAACIPLLVAITAWMVLRGGDEGLPSLPQPQLNDINLLIAQASHHGMILPGAESASWAPREVVRSDQIDPVLKADVEEALGRLDDFALDPGLEIAATLVAIGNPFARIKLDNGLGEQLPPDRYHVLKGIQLWSQKGVKQDEVEKQFRMALEISPDNSVARFNLAYCLWAQNRFDEASLLFEELASGDPGNLITVRAGESMVKVEAKTPLF